MLMVMVQVDFEGLEKSHNFIKWHQKEEVFGLKNKNNLKNLSMTQYDEAVKKPFFLNIVLPLLLF